MRRLSTSGTAAKRRKPIIHGEMKPQKAATSLRLRSRESQPSTASYPLIPVVTTVWVMYRWTSTKKTIGGSA